MKTKNITSYLLLSLCVLTGINTITGNIHNPLQALQLATISTGVGIGSKQKPPVALLLADTGGKQKPPVTQLLAGVGVGGKQKPPVTQLLAGVGTGGKQKPPVAQLLTTVSTELNA